MITITVNPVNDSPIISTIENQEINEDSSLTITLSAEDIDGDDLTFSAIDGNTLIVNGDQLTITPEEDFFGDVEISVSVTDGEFTDSTNFILTVNPVNDPPSLDLVDNQSIDEDNIFSYNLSAFTDMNSENLCLLLLLMGIVF